MTSITKKQPKSKPQLQITFEPAEPGMPILATVADSRGNEASYWIERIEADFGVGVAIRKLSRDGEVHHVNLDTVSWIHDCDCMGFLRHGRCRHVSMAISAMDQGLLVSAPRPVVERRRLELEDDRCPVCDGKTVAWDHCERCNRDVCARCYASGRCDQGAAEAEEMPAAYCSLCGCEQNRHGGEGNEFCPI